MISQAGWWTQTLSTTPLQPIKWNASFWIMFTSDDQPGWLMDSNPICHPSPAKEMKCSFLYYVQLLMISQAGRWTQTPSAIPLQPKKMKCSFLYYIQLLMLARLVNGLKPHPPPLCSQKNEMLLLWITLNFWWLAGLSDGLKPHPPSLSSQKMKCSFLDCVHFWWLAGLVDELEPHLPLLSCQKNEMLIFRLHSTSDDQHGWSMDSKPICHTSQANKMKCYFLDCVHFWWSARLVDEFKPHLPPLSSQ